MGPIFQKNIQIGIKMDAGREGRPARMPIGKLLKRKLRN
jgi:hypothetical protein